jgi:hypothetical protein
MMGDMTTRSLTLDKGVGVTEDEQNPSRKLWKCCIYHIMSS